MKSTMSEIPIPLKCKNCLTGEMLDVWPDGLDYRDSSPCNEYDVCEHVTLERREYCYNVWKKKYPSRVAALNAEMAAERRRVFRQHKTR